MLMRELSAKVLRNSKVKGSIRSQRKRCALAPAFRTAVTHRIFHGFGAQALQFWTPLPKCKLTML